MESSRDGKEVKYLGKNKKSVDEGQFRIRISFYFNFADSLTVRRGADTRLIILSDFRSFGTYLGRYMCCAARAKFQCLRVGGPVPLHRSNPWTRPAEASGLVCRTRFIHALFCTPYSLKKSGLPGPGQPTKHVKLRRYAHTH